MPKLAFRPEEDGFAFANFWNRSDDADIADQLRAAFMRALPGLDNHLFDAFGLSIPMLGILDRVKAAITQNQGPASGYYGMCGGMAYAALDYWRQQMVLPRGAGRDDQPRWQPEPAGVLREYLSTRMGDSLDPGRAALRTLQWMAVLYWVPSAWPFNGGPGWLLRHSQQEFAALKTQILAGQPWPIVLIGDSPSPFDQHHVLAYGYDDPEDGTATLYVYDNAFPDTESVIGLDFRQDRLIPTGDPHTGLVARDKLVGFFCSRYAPAHPPTALGLSAGLTVASQPASDGTLTLTYAVQNTGYSASPPLALRIRRCTAPNTYVDMGGESQLRPIPVGASRTATVALSAPDLQGAQTFQAACRLGSLSDDAGWRELPGLTAGISSQLSLALVGVARDGRSLEFVRAAPPPKKRARRSPKAKT
jgi:hypothetical protein